MFSFLWVMRLFGIGLLVSMRVVFMVIFIVWRVIVRMFWIWFRKFFIGCGVLFGFFVLVRGCCFGCIRWFVIFRLSCIVVSSMFVLVWKKFMRILVLRWLVRFVFWCRLLRVSRFRIVCSGCWCGLFLSIVRWWCCVLWKIWFMMKLFVFRVLLLVLLRVVFFVLKSNLLSCWLMCWMCIERVEGRRKFLLKVGF